MTFAQIILPLSLKGTFTYMVPDFLQSEIAVGKRVLIPFGGKKIYTGIVHSLHKTQPEGFLAKEIISVLDENPILPPEQLSFWNWFSKYYMCHLGELYRYVFPSSLKLESETYIRLRQEVEVDYTNLDANEIFLLQALETKQVINIKEIEAFIPKKEIIKTINSLIDLRFAQIDEQVSEKYFSKQVAYIKIKDDILEEENLIETLSRLKKSPKQKELLVHILSIYYSDTEKSIRKSEVIEKGVFTNTHLKGLIEKGIVEEFYLQKDRLEGYSGEVEKIEQLTPTQLEAKVKIDLAFAEGKNVLLHGVTSSGKTHIFLDKIDEMVQQDRNVLVLLPEVSITKQITSRLEKKYGGKLGFYHQRLTDFERVEIWKKIRNNELRVVIGTTISIFLPFSNLGLIVVDEEHDTAYKSRETIPFFSGKDASLYLSSLYKAKVILSSATPSVESYYLAQIGKLEYVFVGERFGGISVPKIEIVDYKQSVEDKDLKSLNFSNRLYDEINTVLERKKQVMLLHNRRGYSNVMECVKCGYVSYCSNCDVILTYHKASHQLKCHYCGNKIAPPVKCPKCSSNEFNMKGIGVEQIYEETKTIFPTAEVDRMDADSMKTKFAYEKLYEKIENGDTDIIVGTQLIAKGLDFDNIEFVGIPRADQLLYNQDFRVEEKAYQLITQVAGRAGRKSGDGRVLIQTYNPDNNVFQLISKEDVSQIYQYFLSERKAYNYPPFTKLLLIELKYGKEDRLKRAATFLSNVLKKYIPSQCIFGPEKPYVSRINNYYHYQILLKFPRGKKYQYFKDLVEISLEEFNEITAYKAIKIRLLVDV